MVKLYDKDLYEWSMKNAELLRNGNILEIDRDNIAVELESLGKSQKRELLSRLNVLLSHLLKWKYQPEKRSGNWQASILEQRDQIKLLLLDSPSLKHYLADTLIESYSYARVYASYETGLKESEFPELCPFSYEEAMLKDFWPE